MRKASGIFVAVALFATLFLACGKSEPEETYYYVVIGNRLDDRNIEEIRVEPTGAEPSENLLGIALAPGEQFTVTVDGPGTYDIFVKDEYGNTYTLPEAEVGENGYTCTVTPQDIDSDIATITIRNDLGDYTIFYAYCSSSDSDEWGEDLLGDSVLAPGDEMSFDVDAGTYDMKCVDEDDDSYTLWGVPIDSDGYLWSVTLSDLDVQGEGAPVTISNGLGGWTIYYIYAASGDDSWGDDLLGSRVLSPGEGFTFYVPEGTLYRFRVEDEDGDTYTVGNIDIDENGFLWEVTLDDIDT